MKVVIVLSIMVEAVAQTAQIAKESAERVRCIVIRWIDCLLATVSADVNGKSAVVAWPELIWGRSPVPDATTSPGSHRSPRQWQEHLYHRPHAEWLVHLGVEPPADS